MDVVVRASKTTASLTTDIAMLSHLLPDSKSLSGWKKAQVIPLWHYSAVSPALADAGSKTFVDYLTTCHRARYAPSAPRTGV
jgi:hypothetical protein